MISARIALFFLVILSPVGAMILNINPKMDFAENRDLADLPKFKWQNLYKLKFKRDVENYLNDRFGFRKVLAFLELHWSSQIVNKPMIHSVLFGKKPWLYYWEKKSIDRFVENSGFSESELDHMTRVVSAHQRFCFDRGITYLFVIAPDKQSIYPEYLPDWLGKENAARGSLLDQLMAHFKSAGLTSVIDLREILSNVRKDASSGDMLLYWKTDSHWTDFGAFWGAHEIFSRIHEQLPEISIPHLNQFKVDIKERRGGDIARMVGLGSLRTELYPEFSQVEKPIAKRIENPNRYIIDYWPLKKDDRRLIIMETGNATLPKGVMFRDSFTNSLESFLSDSFERIVYRSHDLKGDQFDVGLITSEKPDIVIFQIVERSLYKLLKMKVLTDP